MPVVKNTMEKGNRPTRATKKSYRLSTLGAIDPSYFTIRGAPRLERDEELSILSLSSNVPRGTHFWMGREADLEGVNTGGDTARLGNPESAAQHAIPGNERSGLSASSSGPLERTPSGNLPTPPPSIPSSALGKEMKEQSLTSSGGLADTDKAKKRWSGAFATLRARSSSTGHETGKKSES